METPTWTPLPVVLLKSCTLNEYTEVELAHCYIFLSNEVSKGNAQLKRITTPISEAYEITP